MAPEITRVVALGASNLTLGLQSVVSACRDVCGNDVEVLAALGLGRSYGAKTTVGIRTLPGILQSGLWRELDRLEPAPTRGIITDVGNDIVYGASPAQILIWVREAANRLRAHAQDVVLTGLPMDGISHLTNARFLFFRSIFFPSCRLSHDEVRSRALKLSDGLVRLAEVKGLRFVPLRSSWYGIDPIHIRTAAWRKAWREILFGESVDETAGSFSPPEWTALQLRSPERQRLFGIDRLVPQLGKRLRRGAHIWLY